MAQWMRRRSDCEGCHAICLTGEWWTRTSIAAAVLSDHIQTVVGVRSFLVATIVPSLLNAITEIPSAKCFDVPNDTDVGGLAGCGAAT